MFEKWLRRNNNTTAHQVPTPIQNSFRNLQNPLEYIKNQRIQKLEAESQMIRDQINLEKELIFEMSKNNYKKVISRQKDEYQFGQSFRQQNMHHKSGYQQFQKRSAKKKDENKKMLKIKEQLKLQHEYIHNKFEVNKEQQVENRPMTLQVIKQIDSKDFETKYSNVQFFDLFQKSQRDQKFRSAYSDISENYQMDELFGQIKFNLIDRNSYYSSKSTHFLFRAEEELDFWRRYTMQTQQNSTEDEIQVMKRCQNFNPKQPSFLYLLEFASGKIDTSILVSYSKLKARHETELKINENDQNLQQQYNKKKKQYDYVREMRMKDKSQRLDVKYVNNEAQTNDKNLNDHSFQSYFEETANDLLLKLQQLNKIRDQVLEKRQNEATRKVMLMNIGYQIKDKLFRLLALTVKGETFVNYEEIMSNEDQSIAQRKILQVVYHHFDKVQVLEVDGILKSKILDIYLQQRQKNEKMFELLGRVYGQQKGNKVGKSAKQRQKSKTPQKKFK